MGYALDERVVRAVSLLSAKFYALCARFLAPLIIGRRA